MRHILDTKIEEAIKNGGDLESVNDFYIGRDPNLLARKNRKFQAMVTNGIKVNQPPQVDKWDQKQHLANLEADALKYGRFWMWQGYIDDDLKEKLLDVYQYHYHT